MIIGQDQMDIVKINRKCHIPDEENNLCQTRKETTNVFCKEDHEEHKDNCCTCIKNRLKPIWIKEWQPTYAEVISMLSFLSCS